MAQHPRSWKFDEIEVGKEATLARKVRHSDIEKFGEITGDKNPLHNDPEFARTTIFKEPIAHGMLTAGYVSAVFGMELPGPGAIFVRKVIDFKGPVKPGDVVTSTVTAREKFPAKKRILFDYVSTVGGKKVMEGEAVLQLSA